LGPVVSTSRYGMDGTARARSELGIARDAFVIGVFPGSWTEHRREFSTMVIGAFERLNAPLRTLLWVAGPDHEEISARLAGHVNAHVFHRYWDVDRLMSASDVGITRAN